MKITVVQEFLLKSAVEPFYTGMLLRTIWVGEVMRNALPLKLIIEFSKEFGAVVRMHIPYRIRKDILQFFQEVDTGDR
jgi:hypothetical protein